MNTTMNCTNCDKHYTPSGIYVEDNCSFCSKYAVYTPHLDRNVCSSKPDWKCHTEINYPDNSGLDKYKSNTLLTYFQV